MSNRELILRSLYLYVDIDDTLALWSVGSNFATEYAPNFELISLLVEYLSLPKKQLIVWSTGGEYYAQNMFKEIWEACRTEPLPDSILYESKWPRIPRAGEIYIDDDPLGSFKSHTIHPGKVF